jgi:predicted nucleic acid-binding protein
MISHSPLMTIDSNVIIAALRKLEPSNEKCIDLLGKIPNQFILTEPSIIYQEVCGTLVRKVDLETANKAKVHLDRTIKPKRLINCDKKTCISAFSLCAEHKIYSIDALYLHVALTCGAILVSLDKEFINGLNADKLSIEAYTVEDFPY